MFGLTSTHRYHYYPSSCDMRKGFDMLSGLVKNELGRNPLSGEVFIFMNRPRNTIKLLHWEGDGMTLYHKRLEKGTFSIPQLSVNQTQVFWPELVLMLEGIKPVELIRKARYSQ